MTEGQNPRCGGSGCVRLWSLREPIPSCESDTRRSQRGDSRPKLIPIGRCEQERRSFCLRSRLPAVSTQSEPALIPEPRKRLGCDEDGPSAGDEDRLEKREYVARPILYH